MGNPAHEIIKMINIIFDNRLKKFIATSRYEDRAILKKAGFNWDPDAKKWWTDELSKAELMYDYCDKNAQEEIFKRKRHFGINRINTS